MKKLFLLLSGFWLLAAGVVEAKYVMPKDSLPAKEKQAGRKARYQLRNLDKDGDGRLNLEEFKSRKLSREDRRIIRRQKKEGTYKSPEEIFKAMDVDNAGYVTPEQMADFYAGKEPRSVKAKESKNDDAGGENASDDKNLLAN